MGQLDYEYIARLNKVYTIVICPRCGSISSRNTKIDESNWSSCDCGTKHIKIVKSLAQYVLLTPDERKEYDAHIREKYTLHSDVFDEELYQKTLEGDFERRLEIETEKREMQASNGNDNKPKCPTCGSTNVRHIGGGERAVSVIGLGLFSGKIGKNYECLNCKARW